jgi:hypothetical protein
MRYAVRPSLLRKEGEEKEEEKKNSPLSEGERGRG